MSKHNSIGFGIVGTGMAAELHARAIAACANKGARLVGFASRHNKVPLADEYHTPCMTLDELMTTTEVDVVCICSPSGMHAEQAIKAAKFGKHALVEKPMALSSIQARQVIEKFKLAGLNLGVAFQRRAEPLFQQVKNTVQSGQLGRIVCGLVSVPYRRTMEYYGSAAWRGTWDLDGGGALMNQGIHLLDLLIWWMGDPERIQAHAATLRHDIAVEDSLGAILTFPGGSVATVLATTATEPGFAHRMEIYGTRGGIQIEGEQVLRWQTPAGTAVPALQDKAATAGAGGDPRGIPITGHVGLIENFMAAVRNEKQLLVDGHQGLRSVATVEAIYAAAGLNPKP